MEQSLRQRAPQTIDRGCALTNDPAAADGPFPQTPSSKIGLPDLGEITQPEQVRQDGRVHLVGLDLGFGDGLGGHRIGDGRPRHKRL